MKQHNFGLFVVALGCATVVAQPSFGQESEPAAAGPIEEVIVTGSYIRRQSQFDSPSPLGVIGSEDIQDLGVNEVSDIIEDLSINTGSQNNPDAFTQNFTTGTGNINLRGLGVSSTLVLVNGRRQVQSSAATDRGENFVDTSSLPPMIVFDRIETLKDGATALYGSDAVAGVVNFITRRNFEGFELQAEFQTTDTDAQEDSQISALWGIGNDTTHFLGALSFMNRDPLTTADRRLSRVQDDLSQAGQPGAFLIPSTPGNPAFAPAWTAVFDTNLNGLADFIEPTFGLPAVPGALQPVFADQDCANIAAQDPKVVPQFAATVPSPIGTIPIGACAFDFGEFFSLVPEEQRTTVYAQLTHQFSDRVDGRFEAHLANNEALRNNSPSFPFASFPTIPAFHPDNPYGTNVLFIGRVAGAGGTAVESFHDSYTWRLAGVLTGDFNDIWGWEIAAQRSENEFNLGVPDVRVDRFNAAIQGFGGASCNPATGTRGVGPCQFFNPFGSALTGTGTVNSPALLDDIIGLLTADATSELTTFDGYITGEFGELAGAPIGFATGFQYRDQALIYDYDDESNRDNFLFLTGNPDFSGDRDVTAFFAELAVPLGDTLDVQIAGRFEDYGDSVDSFDPKLSLLWRPTDRFALRASAGTSFRAPSLFQVFGTQTSLAQLVDPLGSGSAQFFPVRTGPSPGNVLTPEEADVLNLGISFSPTDNLEFGLDYWSFDYSDVIIQQNPQAILNAAAAGDPQAISQVVRQAGLIVRVDSFYANASSLETDGFDFTAAYDLATDGAGDFRIGVEGTYVTSYDLQDPQAGSIDGAGQRNFTNFGTSVPELRANGFINWQVGRHRTNVFLRHISSYDDDQNGFQEIDSYFTVDANYSIAFDDFWNAVITVGAINLLDEDPPQVQTNGGYDSKVHDPRGRLWYIRANFGL